MSLPSKYTNTLSLFCLAITFHSVLVPMRVPLLPPQVDVLDRLGGGPEGEQARENWAGLDGRLQQKRVPDQQNGAVAQRAQPGHPSGHPLLGGRLLRPDWDGLPKQHRAQGQHSPTMISVILLQAKGSVVHRNQGRGLFWHDELWQATVKRNAFHSNGGLWVVHLNAVHSLLAWALIILVNPCG